MTVIPQETPNVMSMAGSQFIYGVSILILASTTKQHILWLNVVRNNFDTVFVDAMLVDQFIT